MRRIIGLTGGIGTGKSTVSNYLASHYNLPVLDADIYAREAVEPGSQVLEEIQERYGFGILLPDGKLDRLRLGQIVFSSPSERLWLEQRIHPYVRDRITAQLDTLDPQKYPTVVLVVPLLFEARMTDLVTEIWVVACDQTQQVERVKSRDGLPLEEIQSRINSQMSIEKKLAQANVVLDNSSTPEALLKQVDAAIGNR
ncbi:dephospho-CoA kinase [Microseira wollei]|uniref:Dephospho-CoA kinase n=1 Tax=Microseira wollei NIES-4236 TaxID=2530354 RepID=A0AAV3XB06_9CYAN|nr:dephospho-CoA kinase [Microseira wollei]GET37462.1 dephospho-CoA kinase [Microseira wollei NIES-4236]